MKKVLATVATVLLLLSLIISCDSNTDGLFREISHASKESTYACKSYIGVDNDNTHYVLTKDGILTFKLSDSHKATDIEMLNTGNFKAIRSAGIKENNLILVNAYGNTLQIDLSGSNDPKELGNAYYVSKDGELYTEEVTVLYDSDSNKYELDDSNIRNIEDNYAVIYENGSYKIYNFTGSSKTGIALATLSGKPTAAFKLPNNKIAYKTNTGIYEFDPDTKVLVSKTDGWASELCTATTSITEFVKVSGDDNAVYAIIWTGGIVRIDLNNLDAKAASIF